jgi:hypothetical protein
MFESSYYGGENRHRCPASLNHPCIASDLEALSSSNVNVAAANTDNGDADQNKYNKKAKTFLLQQ